ncbi:MAG: ral secretion pathway protein [Acetobacteraceae bacterium]|jgi:general secretion pathway protein K|nr:ral secretion pathway protein [Acetobacteraceae bacterium]MEA2777941.1 ral secretion pathway protein [Acetobacteraceae bacterium]
MTRQRGFALLMVLWTMGLLALLVTQFATTGRTETRVAANLRANAAAQAAADGGLHEAILRLLQGVWGPDDRPRTIRAPDGVVEIRVLNQASKVNPNVATLATMQTLLTRAGIDPGKAAALSRAIIDWRSSGPKSVSGGSKISQYQSAGLPYAPAGKLFDSVEEIGQVVGMTPALLARIRPFLSVYQESDTEEPGSGTGQAFPATDRDGWYLGSTGRLMVVAIRATATGAKGGRFTRQAIVRLRAEPSLDQEPYQILTWETVQE